MLTDYVFKDFAPVFQGINFQIELPMNTKLKITYLKMYTYKIPDRYIIIPE